MARKAALRAVLAGLPALALMTAVSAQAPDLSSERAALNAYQVDDQRLQDIGWKLVRGNAEFCADTIPAIGLQLLDLASFGRPALARDALEMNGNFAVQTAAEGSPAALAGLFAPYREVTAIGDADPNQWPAKERSDWERLTRAHDWVDTRLAEDGGITITFASGDQASLEPVPACAARFELLGRGDDAVADGSRVVIGRDFPGFDYDEPRLAGAVAHELAHNLLAHRRWLERNGRSRRNVRRTEREADRLMPWLLVNAGYEPEDAVRFMESWGPRHSGGIFRKRTHDGWDERVEFISAEIPLIRAVIEREGRADWSVHFVREIDPRAGLEDASEG